MKKETAAAARRFYRDRIRDQMIGIVFFGPLGMVYSLATIWALQINPEGFLEG